MGNEILNNKRWIVYVYTNKTNGKKYVGQTCRSLEIRSGTKGQGYKQCSHFWNAICKYGWDNFEHEILFENLTHEKANKLEKLLIQILRTQNPEYGYNIQNGGVEGNGVPIEDLTGKRFGRLTVIERDYTRTDEVHWLCNCDCDCKVSVSTHNLNSGMTTSCGCYRKEQAKINNTTHGMTGHPLHKIWLSIKSKCSDQSQNSYKGISLCDEWNDFLNFYEWAIHNGYKEGLLLSRNNIKSDYKPSNCEWITKKEIMQKNFSQQYTYDNKTMYLAEWADYLGINAQTLKNRLANYNMTVEEAFTKPVKKKQFYEYNGESHSLREWSELYGIKFKTLEARLYRGMSIEDALNR